MSAMREPRLILVVDDNHVVAMTVEDALRDAGFAVLTVNSGAEAVMLIEQAEEMAAVVTDIRLEAAPDGWEIARRARELHPDIAIVYISGHSAHEHGSFGVPDSLMLQKPFGRSRLVDAVSAGIARSSPSRH